MQGRHDARHHARADVLEGQRRPVKQLEREDAGLDFDERNLEVERFDDDRFEHRGVQFAAGERAERSEADFGERPARQPGELVRGPRLDRFRDVEATVGRKPVEKRGGERHGGRGTVGGDEAHRYTTRAPRRAMGDT